MTFRPSPLAHALAVIVAWIVCLAIALDRVELFFAAIPLLMPMLRSPASPRSVLRNVDIAAESGPFVEGEELTVSIGADLDHAAGPIEIAPVLPLFLQPLTAGRSAVFVPEACGRVNWDFRLRCRAIGVLDFGLVFFRVWDLLGMWVGEDRHEQRTSVSVYPQAALARLLPAPRQTGAPFGVHPSRRLGDGTDFAGIRSYATGDRVKRVNWPVTLRMQRLHVNEFHTEHSGDIILLIDAFTNIGRRPDSSLDHCLRAAAGLAMGYLRQHDRVGLMEFGGWVRWTRPATGPSQYRTLLESLARITINPAEFLQDLTRLPETMLPRRALVIALTPLADRRFTETVIRLADCGNDVVLLAIRTDELCRSLMPRRLSRRLVQRLWSLEREELLRELRGHGIRAVSWLPSLPIETALEPIRRPYATARPSW